MRSVTYVGQGTSPSNNEKRKLDGRAHYVCADDVSNCYSMSEKHNSHKSHVKVFSPV